MGNKFTSEEEENLIFSKEELRILYENFINLDTNETGKIEYSDLMNVPELTKNPIIKRVFRIFDLDDDGKISFYEYINGLSILANSFSDNSQKMEFLFKIYDNDEDGYISNGDLFKTIKLLIGNNLTNNHLQQMVDRTIILVDKDLDGKISFYEFCDFIKEQNVEVYQLFSLNLFL
jgi:serine/threonine-protein phosphatase 2B regulatory subunit